MMDNAPIKTNNKLTHKLCTHRLIVFNCSFFKAEIANQRQDKICELRVEND